MNRNHADEKAIDRGITPDLQKEPQTLREQQVLLDAIIAASPIPKFVLDKNHRVISWNRALENTTGIRAGEVLGTDLHWKAFYAEKRPCLADLLLDGAIDEIHVMYPGKSHASEILEGAYEATDFFKDLGPGGKWLHIIAAPIRDGNGDLIGAMETLEDITRLVKAQAELQESEERYSALFSNNYSVSLLIDPDTGRIVDTNDAAVQYYGYPREQLLAMGVYDLNRLPKEKVVNNLVRAKTAKARHFPSVHYLAGGEKRYVEIYSGPITVKGKPLFYSIIHDISESYQAGQKLRESEEQYSALFSNSYSVSLLIDPETGRIVEANDAAVQYYGYPRERLLAMGIYDLNRLPEEKVVNNLVRAKGAKARHFQSVHYLAGGEKRYVEIYSGPIPVRGKPLFYSIIHDITDRKIAEAELKKNQYLLSEAMDMAHMADWAFDVETGIFTFNDRFYELYATTAEREGGYQMPAEVYMREFTHPDDVAIVADEITKALARPEPGYFALREHRIIRRDGEIRYIIVRIRVTKDADGRTTGTHGANQDITERKFAEEALRESEERYRTLIEQLPDYIIVHREGTLLYVNPAGASQLSYDAKSLIGKSFFSMVAPASHETVREAVARRMKGEEVPPYEIQILDKNGTLRTVLVHGALISYDGAPSSINVLTDITPLKQAQDAIRQANEELEKRVQKRTEDLRQANVQLTTEITARAQAEQEISKSLEEKVLLLREIHHRVKNNLQIITSLLKLQSRFISDHGVQEAIRDTQSRVRAMSLVHERIYRSPDIAEINLKEYLLFLVRQVAQFYNVQPHQVAISVTMPPIMADIDMVTPLGLIMNELVSNSLKHAFPNGQKGSISITGEISENDRLRFTYHDSGIGMPQNLDWQNSESLGLRLVNSLVDQLDGTITLQEGEGTTFVIDIQKRIGKTPAPPSPETSSDEDEDPRGGAGTG